MSSAGFTVAPLKPLVVPGAPRMTADGFQVAEPTEVGSRNFVGDDGVWDITVRPGGNDIGNADPNEAVDTSIGVNPNGLFAIPDFLRQAGATLITLLVAGALIWYGISKTVKG